MQVGDDDVDVRHLALPARIAHVIVERDLDLAWCLATCSMLVWPC